jgi:hypothetical protein
LKGSKSAKQLRNLKKTIELTGYYAKKVKKAIGRRISAKGRIAKKAKETK